MSGLEPVIQSFLPFEGLDCRVKPGNEEGMAVAEADDAPSK
jgi:hypothetical protein